MLTAMSKLLDKAIAEARKLPVADQDAIGAIILEEIADEARWAKTFAETRPILEAMIAEADAEIAPGETSPLEFTRRK